MDSYYLNLTEEQYASYQRKWLQLSKKRIVLNDKVTLKILISQFSLDYDSALFIKDKVWLLASATISLQEPAFYLLLKYVHALQNNLDIDHIKDISQLKLDNKLLTKPRCFKEENIYETKLSLESFHQFDQRDVQQALEESMKNKQNLRKVEQNLLFDDDDLDDQNIFNDDDEFEIVKARTSQYFEYVQVNSFKYIAGGFLSRGYYVYEIHSKPRASESNKVERRYDDFEKFYMILISKFPNLIFPEFPQKGWFENTHSCATQRQIQFDFFLRELSYIEQVENDEIFKTFLTQQNIQI